MVLNKKGDEGNNKHSDVSKIRGLQNNPSL